MEIHSTLFIIFGIIVFGFLVVDLGYLNRQAHRISTKSAFFQSLFWIAISILYGGAIMWYIRWESASEFMSAYLTEKMLSVDNLFVILLIFNFFKLDPKYHHKVLFWGIMGAIVFRGIFIGLGSVIIHHFHWILYVFGAVLVYTGFKLVSDKKEEHADLNKSKVLRLAQKYLPLTTEEHKGKFVLKTNGKYAFTTLFLIVLMIETTDIVFALDSIPAVFAISSDPFIVFTSNIFAIMGLRALFFLIEGVIEKFHYLQKGLAFVLIFIGGKMIVDLFGIHISSVVSFTVIITAFIFSLGLSILFPKPESVELQHK